MAVVKSRQQVVLSALRSAGRALLYAAVDLKAALCFVLSGAERSDSSAAPLKAGVDVLLQLLECHGSVLSCCTLHSDEDVQSLARRGLSCSEALDYVKCSCGQGTTSRERSPRVLSSCAR